jgi:hypothetical protein
MVNDVRGLRLLVAEEYVRHKISYDEMCLRLSELSRRRLA